jgi:deoxyadenosine kinase
MLRDSGLMEERDYLTYVDLFQNMSNFMKKPNLIVHLDVTPEESVERIKRRNRSCECGIPLEYLQNLHSAYETFITNISRTIPVIKVNWNTFQTAEDMAKMVRLEYLKMENIRSVSFNQPWPKPMASLSNAAAASDDTAKAEIGSQEAELVAAAGAIKIDGA